jgi:hypothetical protein
MKKSGEPPKQNSRQWVKNEKLISKNSYLRRARDKAEGFKPSSGITTGANDQEYKDGYDKINWTKNKPKPSFRVKINGKYQDEE